MKCYKCPKKVQARTDNKGFCKKHFLEVIEKRIRKEIRVNNLINKNDKIIIVDDKTEKSAVLKYLIPKIIKDPSVKIGKEGKKVLPHNLDDEATNYLKSLFEVKSATTLHSKNEVNPLVGITREETLTYAKFLGLKFKESKPHDKDIQLMIDSMEKRYPATKFGILKTIRKTR